MNKSYPGPSHDVFSILPGSLNPPSDPTGDWWVDLEEVDLQPPFDPTGEDEFLRLDLMGELQLMALKDRLFFRRFFGLCGLAWPLLRLRAWWIRASFNRQLRGLGHGPIPRSFQPGKANQRF